MSAITIRVIFNAQYEPRNGPEDIDFPTVPRIGEAVFIPERDGDASIWIVSKVGYLAGTGTALPCIEVDEWMSDGPPPYPYDRMIAGS